MDIHEYFGVLRRGWALVVLGLIVGIAGGAAAHAIQPRAYAATSREILTNSEATGDLTQSLQASNLAEGRIASYVLVATSGLVLQPVIDELKLDMTVQDLAGHLSVVAPPNTLIVEITATAATPQLAKSIANTVSAVFSDVVENQIENAVSPPVGATDTADGQPAVPATAPVRIVNIEHASLPTAPTLSNAPLLLAVGAILGLALGLVGASLRESLDRRVRGRKDVAAVTDRPVLGQIRPDRGVRGSSIVMRTSPQSAIAESFRGLRASVEHVRSRDGVSAIVITAMAPRQGASLVAANLALAIADTATTVVVVDANLQAPSQAEIFGVDAGPGLTDLLTTKAALDEVIAAGPGENIWVLPIGSRRERSADLLATPRMRALIAELQSRFDVVILDTPAISSATDATVLGSFGAATLLVAAEGTASRPGLADALSALAAGGSVPAGVVLNQIPRSTRGRRPARPAVVRTSRRIGGAPIAVPAAKVGLAEAPVAEVPPTEAPLPEVPLPEVLAAPALPVEVVPAPAAVAEGLAAPALPVDVEPAAEEAPVEDAAVEDAPLEDAPVEDAPADAPVDEAADEALASEAPAPQALVDDVPFELVDEPVVEAPAPPMPVTAVPEVIIPAAAARAEVVEVPVVIEKVLDIAPPVVESTSRRAAARAARVAAKAAARAAAARPQQAVSRFAPKPAPALDALEAAAAERRSWPAPIIDSVPVLGPVDENSDSVIDVPRGDTGERVSLLAPRPGDPTPEELAEIVANQFADDVVYEIPTEAFGSFHLVDADSLAADDNEPTVLPPFRHTEPEMAPGTLIMEPVDPIADGASFTVKSPLTEDNATVIIDLLADEPLYDQPRFEDWALPAQPDADDVEETEPEFDASVYDLGARDEQHDEAPVYDVPVYEIPLDDAPVYEVPVYDAPVVEQSAAEPVPAPFTFDIAEEPDAAAQQDEYAEPEYERAAYEHPEYEQPEYEQPEYAAGQQIAEPEPVVPSAFVAPASWPVPRLVSEWPAAPEQRVEPESEAPADEPEELVEDTIKAPALARVTPLPTRERLARESYLLKSRELERVAQERLRYEQERLEARIREQLEADRRQLAGKLDELLEDTVMMPRKVSDGS